jgi:hypothetical protein
MSGGAGWEVSAVLAQAESKVASTTPAPYIVREDFICIPWDSVRLHEVELAKHNLWLHANVPDGYIFPVMAAIDNWASV